MRTLEEDIEDLMHEKRPSEPRSGSQEEAPKEGKQEEFREELVKFNLKVWDFLVRIIGRSEDFW